MCDVYGVLGIFCGVPRNPGRFARGSFRPWVVSPGRFALSRFALVLWVGRFALTRWVVSPVSCFAHYYYYYYYYYYFNYN